MGVHQTYTYLQSIIPDSNWQKVAVAAAVGVTLVMGGRALTARIATAQGREAAIVPDEKISLFGLLDLFVERWIKLHDATAGRQNRKHAPFSAAIFLFIFLLNLIGLVPGMPAATTTVWLNVAMALVVFGYFNYQGVRAHGAKGYLAHFAGPVWWLAWLIFPLEIFSTVLRVLTLNLRLYWNINADHVVLGVFTDSMPTFIRIGVPVIFYGLGTFVALMQAFVFSLLTMVYVKLATEHSHGEDEGHHGDHHASSGH